MIEGLTFNKIKENGWDTTAEYDVTFTERLTVGHFVDRILKSTHDWGYIGIRATDSKVDVKHAVYGYPCIEYQYGDIITRNNLKRFSDRVIKSVHASGGWSRMDYLLSLYEESESL